MLYFNGKKIKQACKRQVYYMSHMVAMEHTYTKKLFCMYLKFKLNWGILFSKSGNPTFIFP